MKASVRLSDGSVQKLTVPATVNSVMLTNHLSFIDGDDENEAVLDIQLGLQEWQMYLKFVTEIARLEKETGKKFSPNRDFSKYFFGEATQEELNTYAKVADYMLCPVLHDSRDIFIGTLFDLDRATILNAYNVRESPDLKKQSCQRTHRIVNDLLVAKALEIVPELAGLGLTFTD